MSSETYNGWTNRETWLVGLWIDNDEPEHRMWRERTLELRASADAVQTLASELRTRFTDESGEELDGLMYDLMCACLDRVNWLEIAKNMLEQS